MSKGFIRYPSGTNQRPTDTPTDIMRSSKIPVSVSSVHLYDRWGSRRWRMPRICGPWTRRRESQFVGNQLHRLSTWISQSFKKEKRAARGEKICRILTRHTHANPVMAPLIVLWHANFRAVDICLRILLPLINAFHAIIHLAHPDFILWHREWGGGDHVRDQHPGNERTAKSRSRHPRNDSRWNQSHAQDQRKQRLNPQSAEEKRWEEQ